MRLRSAHALHTAGLCDAGSVACSEAGWGTTCTWSHCQKLLMLSTLLLRARAGLGRGTRGSGACRGHVLACSLAVLQGCQPAMPSSGRQPSAGACPLFQKPALSSPPPAAGHMAALHPSASGRQQPAPAPTAAWQSRDPVPPAPPVAMCRRLLAVGPGRGTLAP